MARTMQTARKSTGGRAPRKQLFKKKTPLTKRDLKKGPFNWRDVAQINESSKASAEDAAGCENADISRYAIDLDVGKLLQYGQILSEATTRLNMAFTSCSDDSFDNNNNNNDGDSEQGSTRFRNAVETMPVFDIDSIGQDRRDDMPLNHFIVSRRPIVLNGAESVNKHAKRLMEHVLDRCSKKYPNSRWLMLWKNHPEHGFSLLPQRECDRKEYAELEQVLESGRLYGCDLRGNAETAQLGLVTNRPLPKHTAVAVECGIIWSERLHDEVIKTAGEPLLGLASNSIPAEYLKAISTPREWKVYKKACGSKGRIPGLIIECSTHGNETRHIDDPGWLYMSDSNVLGTNVPKHNLESRVLLDLKRKVITCVFETIEDVPVNTELTMNWGCWGSICEQILPGQAQISIVLCRREEMLKTIAQKCKIEIGGIDGDNFNINRLLYFDAKRSIFSFLEEELDITMNENSVSIEETLGKEFELLGAVFENNVSEHLFDTTQDAWCKTKMDVVDERYPGVRYAHRSNDKERLSMPARKKMDSVPNVAYTAFDQVKAQVEANFESSVEVVEITDPMNPAKLFALPGKPALGVRATRNFRKNFPVISYGGTIQQLDENASRNAYFFDVDMPEEYTGPTLFVDGKRSIGGLVNDPWSPPGFPRREANIISVEHWCIETNTPQIVFYALRHIKKGEELLYHYGRDYWKVMWISLIRDHAEYAMKTANRCSSIRNCLVRKGMKVLDKKGLTESERELLFKGR